MKHPLTGCDLPIFVTSYVNADYGAGAIMGVPAHDDRDYAFASKNNLPLIKVAEDDILI